MLLCSAFSTSSFPTTHSFAFGFLKTMRGAGREGSLEEKISVLVFLDSDCWFPLPGKCYTSCLISCSFRLSLAQVSLSTFCRGPHNPRQPSLSDCVHSSWFLPGCDLSRPFGPQETTYIFAYLLPSYLVKLISFLCTEECTSSRGQCHSLPLPTTASQQLWALVSALFQTSS